MSRIFISHSSTDNAKTRAILEWIVSQGWRREEIFVDFDDIGGGQRWRDALKKAASRCEAVVFLISPTWRQRDWCGAEAFTAQMLGKQIIPVLIEPTPPDTYRDLLTVEYQLIDLTVPGPQCVIDVLMPDTGQTLPVALAESGLQRLVVGLKRAGLDPSTFPLTPGRKIYPGLAPLDTDDAAVFFGRDADIARGIETLRQMRERGQSLLAILAASGAGKSSFLRAGLWPRLQRADREFLILPVLRPGVDALNGEQGLVAGLHHAGETLGLKRNLADWRAQIESGDFAGALTVLHTAARARMLAVDAAQPASASQTPASQRHASLPPIPVLPIDQAEELFGAQGGEPARRLLDLLGAALREGRLIVVLAIRSDRYGDLQTAQALAGLEQRPFSLPPIADGVLKDVIEGPAQRDRKERGANGLNIDPQLTDRLLRDWADADGLPLLAFTLRRLLDDYGSDGRLNLEDYERSGQLQGALEAAITRAMQAATAAGSLPEDAQAREALIRGTFVPWLVSVDPQSQQAQRRIALRSELPAETRDLIDRLIDARLLTCDRPHDSDATIEIAHEAILHHWPLLDRIIGQEREALIVLNEVKRDAGAWLAFRKGDDATESEDALLHRGERLRHAEEHLARGNFQRALDEDGQRYLEACRARETKEIEKSRLQQQREMVQIARTRKLQQRAWAFLGLLVVGIAIACIILLDQQKTTSQASADVLASLAAQAFERNEYDRATRFALAGLRKQDLSLREINASAALNQLLRASHRSRVYAKLNLRPAREAYGPIFSPDGSKFVVLADNDIIQLWDTARVRKIKSIPGFSRLREAVFSPNSHRLVTSNWGPNNPPMHIWDSASGKKIATIDGGGWGKTANFSSDGNYIVIATKDGIVKIWNIISGKLLVTIKPEGNVSEAFFSPDCLKLITISETKAQVRDVNSGNIISSIDHDDNINTAVFSSDGALILTASKDKTARLWDSESGRLLFTMQHQDEVVSAKFIPGRHRIVTTSYGQTSATVWDIKTQRKIWTIQNFPSSKDIFFSSDGSRVLGVMISSFQLVDSDSGDVLAERLGGPSVNTLPMMSSDSKIIYSKLDGNNFVILDAVSRSELVQATLPHEIQQFEFSHDSKRVFILAGDTIYLWDIANKVEVTRLKHESDVNSMTISPDDKYLLVATKKGGAYLWDASYRPRLLTISHLDERSFQWNDEVIDAATTRDGKIAWSIFDKRVLIWDTDTGQKIQTMNHEMPIDRVYFSPSENHLAVIDSGFLPDTGDAVTAYLWEIKSGLNFAKLQHKARINSLRYSPDGKLIVTASNDNTARLWEAASGKLITEINHGDKVPTASFSRTGAFVASSSWDKTVNVLETASGKLITTLHHESYVIGAIFLKQENIIATVSANYIVRIWDVFSGKELKIIAHKGFINDISSDHDGAKIVTSSNDGTAKLYDVNSPRKVLTLPHPERVHYSTISPIGSRVVTLSADLKSRLWDANSGRLITELDIEKSTSKAVFSEDGRYFLVNSDENLFVYESASGNEVAVFVHDQLVYDYLFTSKDQRVFAFTRDSLHFWDTSLFFLHREDLIEKVCQTVLGVNAQSGSDLLHLSQLTDQELQMAAVINPKTERDVCRPPTRWQRFASMFGIEG